MILKLVRNALISRNYHLSHAQSSRFYRDCRISELYNLSSLYPVCKFNEHKHSVMDTFLFIFVCLSFTPTNRHLGPITGLRGASSLTSLSEKTAVPPGSEPGSPSFKAKRVSQPGYGGTTCSKYQSQLTHQNEKPKLDLNDRCAEVFNVKHGILAGGDTEVLRDKCQCDDTLNQKIKMLSVVINSESCGCNTCGASDTDGDKGVVNDVNFECMKDRLICDDPEGSSLKITFPKAMFESERSQPTDVKKTSDTDKNRGKWKNSKHVKSTRPNYFIGIQVNDKNILDNVKLVQETMIQNEPLLKSAMIPVATFHLTLLVMHLASNEEIQRAGDLLKQCYEEIKEDFLANPVSLEFSGLNHFNNQVLFAQVKSDAELARVTMLAHSIHKAFTESKFNLSGNKEFKPHATLCKLSKDPGLRKKGVEQIREETFIKHINDQFGKQTVTGLQLLSMMKRKDTSGYYFTEKEYKFVNDL